MLLVEQAPSTPRSSKATATTKLKTQLKKAVLFFGDEDDPFDDDEDYHEATPSQGGVGHLGKKRRKSA